MIGSPNHLTGSNPARRLRAVLATITALAMVAALAACQTGAPALSLEEAKKITAKFSGAYTPPPRSVADVVALIGKIKPIQNLLEHCQFSGPPSDEDVRRRLNQMPPMAHENFRRGFQGREHAQEQLFLGNYRSAIKYIKWILDEVPSDAIGGLAEFGAQLASLYAHAGEFDEADDALRGVIGVKSNLAAGKYSSMRNGERMSSYVLDSHGTIAVSRGELTDAEAYFRNSIETGKRAYEFIDWGTHQALSKMALVEVLVRQGRLLEAENLVRESFDDDVQDRSSKFAHGLMHFAEVLYEQGRYGDAETIAGAAAKMFVEACAAPASIYLARSRSLLAKALAAQGRWKQAIAQYDAVQAGFAKDPDTFNRLFAGNLIRAVALLRAGRGAEAEKALGVTLTRTIDRLGGGHYKVAEIKGFMGATALAHGRQEQAFKLFGEAVPVLLAKGRDANDEGSTLKARNSRLRFVLGTYIGLLADAGDRSINGAPAAWEAFRLAEAGRSKTNQDALAASGARAGLKDPGLADLVRREQDTAKQLATLYGSLSRELSRPPEKQNFEHRENVKALIEQYRKARVALNAEIEARFPDYADLINPKPAGIADARAQLAPGEALIATFVGEKRTYVWAVPKTGDVAFAAVDLGRDDIRERVSHLRLALAPDAQQLADIPAFDLAAAHDLYAKLLAPVAAGWKGANSLLVVADGALGQLPFSLLVTKPTTLNSDKGLLFAGYRAVPWLARGHAVTYLPSVASLKALRATRVAAAPRPFVGFGDPYFSVVQLSQARSQLVKTQQVASRGISLRSAPKTRGIGSAEIERLPRLADTRDEIIAVAGALGATPARDVFLGERATEDQVKSMDLTPYRVISFATHGLVPGDLNGLDQPALALSSPKVTRQKGDGLLTMGEILGLKLNADWAVLSACNTAAADGQGAEAVSGLGRAFFYAGARALLVSNWPVHSGATTELMTRLFRLQAAEPGIARAEALKRTRLAMIDEATARNPAGQVAFSYAHPIFWAPFTVVGDGGGTAAFQ